MSKTDEIKSSRATKYCSYAYNSSVFFSFTFDRYSFDEWFIATGWTMPAFAPETLTREFLDQLIPDRPAFIEDETGGHTAWFNTMAMEAAGLTKEFVDTPEIFYSRTEDGDISGLAFEGGLNAFYAVMPPFDTELRKIAYMKLLDQAKSKGITAVGDAYVFEPDLQAYQELKKEGRLQHRAVPSSTVARSGPGPPAGATNRRSGPPLQAGPGDPRPSHSGCPARKPHRRADHRAPRAALA